ncbi:FbpB family small basic protein [Evansella sp. AB-P1]|nr:FbpB family small basic protein [Evansella sp. AB-P1]MDG5786114.1 FbpB family small basic protein [Evansella sp. AB-P1]
MRRRINKTFEELVNENKELLLQDDHALEEIEQKVDEKYTKELQKA